MKHITRKAFAVAALAAGALMIAPAAAQAGGPPPKPAGHGGGFDFDFDQRNDCGKIGDQGGSQFGLLNLQDVDVDVQALSGIGILGYGSANQNDYDINACIPSNSIFGK
ncbi:hypothetical protein GCM10010112_79620 [Actinoplanes lobatus]|uniref:Uncharacterized protein n=1 Tax=Actinoplanes lobatus TaxID=113568 RepID=A0A7W7HHU7_9ACTN|nr:hypothetical protein [Actinoplanes lobatus]MBB4750830.1 hypothetical protein [Actinoplanes lobatus]GGN92430.1 hypothetical protein GCM10010112_79620 [Actinoplanes lobatus]GIE44385.1 hypothetical protein Alo02nite_72830 [Actinoplanes lobatus]